MRPSQSGASLVALLWSPLESSLFLIAGGSTTNARAWNCGNAAKTFILTNTFSVLHCDFSLINHIKFIIKNAPQKFASEVFFYIPLCFLSFHKNKSYNLLLFFKYFFSPLILLLLPVCAQGTQEERMSHSPATRHTLSLQCWAVCQDNWSPMEPLSHSAQTSHCILFLLKELF